MTDAGFILTKNRIIAGVYEMFGGLADEFRVQAAVLPQELQEVHPKISKGENYLGLPWVMLDYPRRFGKTDVFAVRCFFWWGNYFSFNLQLQGRYQQLYADRLKTFLDREPDGWQVSTGSDPWQHHIDTGDYQPYNNGMQLEQLPFLKLAKKIPLNRWDETYDFLVETFSETVTCLSSQAVE